MAASTTTNGTRLRSGRPRLGCRLYVAFADARSPQPLSGRESANTTRAQLTPIHSTIHADDRGAQTLRLACQQPQVGKASRARCDRHQPRSTPLPEPTGARSFRHDGSDQTNHAAAVSHSVTARRAVRDQPIATDAGPLLAARRRGSAGHFAPTRSASARRSFATSNTNSS